MVLDVDVLGVWLDLWNGGNFNCPTVVFKNPTVNGWLGAAKPKPLFVNLLDHFHDGHGCAEPHAQSDTLALGGVESNLSLKFRGPVEWASSIHDNDAMPGLGSVGVLGCFTLVPVASKVCVNIDIKR